MLLKEKGKDGLIRCPSCQLKGITQILGDVQDDGSVLIKRYGAGLTKVFGEHFTIVCGNCGDQVFYHNERGQDLHYGTLHYQWSERVYRLGTPSGTA